MTANTQLLFLDELKDQAKEISPAVYHTLILEVERVISTGELEPRNKIVSDQIMVFNEILMTRPQPEERTYYLWLGEGR